MELVDCTPTGLMGGLPREVADGAKTHEQKLRRPAIGICLSAAANAVAVRLYSGDGTALYGIILCQLGMS